MCGVAGVLAGSYAEPAGLDELKRMIAMLGHRGPALARLAEVDAVMEMTLSPREQKLLAGVPALLGRHFDQLQPATDAAAPGLLPAADGSWLSLFRKDMQAALMAELDIRFKPIDALLAALRPR